MTKENKISLKEIRKENKIKRAEAKQIQDLTKNKIKSEKLLYKEKINFAKTSLEKKKLKEDYKNKFNKGLQKNKKKNIIDIKGLQKYYCNGINCEHILHNISLSIEKGKVIVILGASGSGKSTLLNIISGLTPPTDGDVVVAGKNMFYLSESKRTKFREENLSFVFQSYNLIPSLTVIENIKVGENLRSKNAKKIPIDEILETLGLNKQAKKYPYQLSGGQNQRVSIGRALAKNPRLLFADEPTGALDEERGKEALQLLLDINEKYGTTLVMVTHNPNFVKVSDITLHIKNGQIDKIIETKNKKKAKDIS